MLSGIICIVDASVFIFFICEIISPDVVDFFGFPFFRVKALFGLKIFW